MNETIIGVVGNVATQPVCRETQNGPSVRFRLAVTSRYLDREKSEWRDGHTNFFTVWASRQLAANAGDSLSVGEPVIVQGRLKVRTEVREGQTWTSADIDAVAIGHDMARGVSLFRRGRKPEAVGAATQHEPSPHGSSQTEPNWETPVGEAAEQQDREPVAVT
ncbi:single-stranded DNA-binding protein [Streptomyces sp. NPDC046909]|uniref:single-stranded DNA-binding protein n=1 Tax=Streptomyces sp. NPDC046909 TaxID=3155617 RepID=UPI0033FE9B91